MHRLSRRLQIHPLLLTIFFVLLLIASTAASGYIIENNETIKTFDRAGYEYLQNIPHPNWLNNLVAPINFNFLPFFNATFLSFLLIIIFIVLIFIAVRRRVDFWWAMLACVIASSIDLIFAYINPLLNFRERPFLALPNTLSSVATAIWQSYPSYPSGHVRDTTLFLVVLVAFLPKHFRYLALAIILFVAFSRVYLGAHYPTDVLMGILVGYLMAKITLSAVEEIRLVWLASHDAKEINLKFTPL